MKKLSEHHFVTVLLRIGTVFLLYFLCRVLFFVINKSFFENVAFADFLVLSFWGLRFDLVAILYLNLGYLLLAFLPFRIRIRKGYQQLLWHTFIWVNILGIVANTIDFGYFPFILQRSTASIFSFASREGNMLELLTTLGLEFWYVPLSALLLGGLFWVLNKQFRARTDFENWSGSQFTWANAGILLIVLGLLFIGIRGQVNPKVRPIGILQAGKYVKDPRETAIVLNTPFSILRTLQKTNVSRLHYFSTEELNSIYTPFHKVSGNQTDSSTTFKRKNVVLIILESFGKEYSGYLNPDLMNGTYAGYMPFLDSLMQQSRVYPNGFANGRKSIMAVPSIIASIPSFDVAYSTSSYANNKVHSIPNLLKKKGYTSVFYHGAENGSMNFESFAKLAGYDRYYGRTEFEKDHAFEGNVWGVDDEPFFQFFAEGLKQEKKPFFATFFSLSSHTPFELPKKHKEKFEEGPLGIHKMIRYSDFALKRFFDSVKNEPWFNNTLFVITADHCSIPFFETYKTSAANYAIPFIFYEPVNGSVGIDSTVVQQLDVMPSILANLRYNEDYYAFGSNMADRSATHFAINYHFGNYQLIRNGFLLTSDQNTVKGIYDLEADPLQKNNMAGQGTLHEKELERFLKAILQQHNNRMLDNKFCRE